MSIIGIVLAGIIIAAVLLVPSRDNERSRALAGIVADYQRDQPEGAAVDNSALTAMRVRSTERTAKLIANKSWAQRLATGLSSAGMSLRPEEFVLVTIGSSGFGGLILYVLSRGSMPAGVLGLVVGFAIPPLVLRFRASRRQARFIAEMPDMLSALASGMSSGASLLQAIEGIAADTTGPMADELTRAIMETRLGTSVPDALEQSAERMHCRDLNLVVMAMRLQSMHGGNLTELLNTVSATLRERVQMQRHVRSLSAEGRLSLVVLMSLPVVMLVFMAVVRPEYFNYFITTSKGIAMLIGGSVAMLLGYLWARAIVAVEV
ncbi:MAG: type II secretion system F family protein [Actinobacteria bacterium]|nr:type II secretion system F family protein [Actinomycetota bacterium]